jgi:hypothetical protein
LKIFESLVENLQKEEVLFNICLLFFVLKKSVRAETQLIPLLATLPNSVQLAGTVLTARTGWTGRNKTRTTLF